MTARAEEVAERYRASALESAKRAAGHLRATAAKLEAKADELLSVEHVSLDAIVELHEVAARGTGNAQNSIARAAHNHARAVLWQERAKAARVLGAPPEVVERSAAHSAREVAEWWPGSVPDPRTGEVA